MASYQIANLLEKMMSNDKDFRFMATNDLMGELQKDSIKLDDESEKKVCRMVLKLLEDKNGEVQNLAVKCLGPLVNKVKEPQVGSIVDCLCTNMIAPNNEHLRDISSIGLKIVISELPQTSTTLAPLICERITDKLNKTIEKENVSVQLEALDILSDLLSRFSDYMLPHHEKILIALVPQLESQRQAIRKRTIVALSHLLTSCNDHAYNEVIVHLSNGLRKPGNPGIHRTYIQCLASICRQSGHRLSRHIDELMELLKKYSADDDDELREFCLQACEAFVYRCPEAIVRHIPDIVGLCLKYITYDPNYNYEADDFEGAHMDTEDDDEVDSEEYSDDDDMSWKVRRSAAKCLEAVIATRRELLEDFYRTLSPALIARFKEREENVKSDIFHAYIALLRATRPAESEISSNNPDSMDQIPVPISLLQDQIPSIVKAIQPLMREKSVKTRQDCFLLLKELLTASPGALANYVDALIPGINYSLCDKNSTSNIKIDALSFVYTLFISHNPQAFHRHISVLVPLIETAVGDTFYKIATEALLVLQQLVKVIRPLDIQVNFEFAPFVGNLYHCTLNKLGTPEVDQEVRERAIACMGQIIANMGDVLQPELVVCLPIFMDRLRNDVTRLSAVKALTMIAASPLRVNLSPIMDDVIPALGSFLRKNYRALKLHSLTLLDTLILNYSNFIAPQLLQQAITEVPPLVSDSDLHVAQLSLILLTSSAKYRPEALIKDSEQILSKTLKLIESPLLQGAALTCMMKFYKTLVEANLPGLHYRNVLVRLTGLVQNARTPLHKQVFHSVARCIAAITEQSPNEAISVAKEFMGVIQNPQNDNHLVFCLLTIGEIGRHFNLSHIEVLPQFILKCFGATSEDVKGAASHALGAVAVGNLSFYLPLILREIEAQPKRQYLLLNSIKELISSLSTTQSGLDQLLPSVPQIWMQLFKYCECSEEGSRNVVAECLGKLVIVQPEQLLPQLQAALSNRSPLMRTAAVTAIKFTISDQPQAIDYLLKQCIRQFLLALKDTEPSVRRVALVAFNSAVHNKPALVRDLLPELLPLLYEETKPKKELIREVEMGPFKHTVDDGLDIRKAAFECMYTLLEQGLDRVDIILFLEHVQIGLNDHYDIKMLTYLMTARLAHLCPSHVLQHLDQFVDPLRATCTLKVKANSVKQEHEKQDELKRSALRAVVALLQIPEADKNQHLSEFLQFIKTSSELQPLFETVQKDNNTATNNSSTDAAPLSDKNSPIYMV